MAKKNDMAVAPVKSEFPLIDETLLKSRIYIIRGVNFRFQLTLKEAETCSRSKISSLNNNRRGTNIKYAPYAFTEQGIYMLMTVLKGERATAQSKALIRLFKQMKDYIVAENQQLLGTVGIAQIAAQTAQNTQIPRPLYSCRL
jgi:hypothetical protein